MTIQPISPLTYMSLLECPYVLAGDAIKIIPLAARIHNTEVGYYLYLSFDGATYKLIGQVASFQPHGVLVDDYAASSFTVDEETGFRIAFDAGVADVDNIETIGLEEALAGLNTAILGTEIISVQTITPVSGNIYQFTGIIRGRWDTEKQDHYAGENFWFLGTQGFEIISNPEFTVGSTRWFKVVPYNSSSAESLANSRALEITFTGRARGPYKPSNLMANNAGSSAKYASDIVLSWDCSIRGQGAGIGNASKITDSSPYWEGRFEVQVYVDDVLVRTTSYVNALTWTYTAAMNISDNGALADIVVLKVSNYIETTGTRATFDSGQISIAVEKE